MHRAQTSDASSHAMTTCLLDGRNSPTLARHCLCPSDRRRVFSVKNRQTAHAAGASLMTSILSSRRVAGGAMHIPSPNAVSSMRLMKTMPTHPRSSRLHTLGYRKSIDFQTSAVSAGRWRRAHCHWDQLRSGSVSRVLFLIANATPRAPSSALIALVISRVTGLGASRCNLIASIVNFAD